MKSWLSAIVAVALPLVLLAEIPRSGAFATSPFIEPSRDSPQLSKRKQWHDPSSHQIFQPLYVTLVAQNETTSISSALVDNNSLEAVVTTNTIFPVPPPAPTDEELHAHGLPILVEAVKHAKAGRTMCYELPENGNVATGYRTVLRDTSTIAKFIASKKKKDCENTIEKPMTIVHLTEPGSEYLASLWGTWAAGYCTVPLATSHRAHEFEHVLQDANPDAIIIGGHVTRKDEEDGTKMKTLPPHNEGELLQAANALGMADRIVYLRDLIGEDGLFHYDVEPAGESTSEKGCGDAAISRDEFALGAHGIIASLDSPAMIMYTSGTTGAPKGCLTTHRNIYHQITDLVSSWEWKPTDVALHLLPLHHVHGVINVLLCANFAGACVEFMHFRCEEVWNRLADASRNDSPDDPVVVMQDAGETSAERQIRRYTKKKMRPNVLMAVPTIYSKMLEAVDHNIIDPSIVADAAKTLASMRLMITGSAAMPVSVNEKWKNLTGHTLLERYGMTEFAMALSNPYKPMEERLPGYVGLPLPSVEVRVVDEHGNVVPPKSGKSGELQVRGPHVFQCYHNLPDVTKKEFASDGSGYFKTGDIAMYDAGKRAYKILGRASVDIIKNGGHKLSALEIERDLLEHPCIAELAVMGIPDDTWGERVAMVCRMKEGEEDLDLDTLRCWAEHRMARYKVPSRIIIVDEIPKNAMGKINKKALKSLFDEEKKKVAP